MQHYIETEGDTVEEAIEHALNELEVTREQVTIDIVNEPTKGDFEFRRETSEGSRNTQARCHDRTGDNPKGAAHSDGN